MLYMQHDMKLTITSFSTQTFPIGLFHVKVIFSRNAFNAVVRNNINIMHNDDVRMVRRPTDAYPQEFPKCIMVAWNGHLCAGLHNSQCLN